MLWRVCRVIGALELTVVMMVTEVIVMVMMTIR